MPLFTSNNKNSRGEFVTVEVDETNAAILRASGRYRELSGEEAENATPAVNPNRPALKPTTPEEIEAETGTPAEAVTEVPAEKAKK